MKEIVNFSIYRLNADFPIHAATLPTGPHEEVRDLLANYQIGDWDWNSAILTANCTPSDPVLAKVLSILRNEGWTPTSRYLCDGEAEKTKTFGVRILRAYHDSDLDAAQLLKIEEWGTSWITGTSGIDPQTGCLLAEAEYVGQDSGEGWSQKSGLVSGHHYVIHPSVRSAFEKAGLIGLGYLPLQWLDPENAKGEYWEITPVVRMPPSLTPVVDHENCLDFDDGPFEPQELRYRSADVNRMGKFDVAWTLEETPNFYGPEGKHRLIVSQRFRQVCKDLGLHVTYAPVRLDAPPPELPWFFTADSPPANA